MKGDEHIVAVGAGVVRGWEGPLWPPVSGRAPRAATRAPTILLAPETTSKYLYLKGAGVSPPVTRL